ncbi:sigma-54 interaction domain-containing protein [Aquabacterium sp.]|uniref:sigma-54 interaction domain-containing protein n=1 Tax=Aquabacterium sp. TaxID=1872578 RepID=UPI002BCA68E1|nr:sigma-54 dependent transcriptional regulator [Aquabacterium sp.]HSW09235.1 sigma-54 dependent transcriptional regulator [Aquabacterium sp.]
MPDSFDAPRARLLTLPESPAGALSIRAKALLFHDPRSAALLEQAERIARSEATVLINGETGTGKELIARHLHTQSGRKGPFLAVNCGAFSETMIDAELFGHETGAYTGAVQSRAGWFEAANGGTLFLDEIGDLPLALQVKLLRVLQERQVVRLGSRRSIPLDVRLVAATNIDLREAVAAQHFRADLYYRLSVATLALPALRERPGDILPLARHFVGVYGPRLSCSGALLAPEAQQALLDYAWPGNIRELENVIHFALIVCRDGIVQAGDLKLVPSLARAAPTPATPAATTEPAASTEHADPASADPAAPGAAQQLATLASSLLAARPAQLLHKLEAALVHAAFAQTGENQVQSARLLGVTRNTMRTLLKRHGLLDDAPEPEPAPRAGDELRLHPPFAH